MKPGFNHLTHGNLLLRRIVGVALFIAVATLLAPQSMRADTEPAATDSSSRQWYDTMAVTKARFARITAGEKIALAAFTLLSIPVGLAVGGTSVIPPALAWRNENGEATYGLALGAGFGFGGDTTATIHFPDLRVQLDVGYYFERDQPILVHATGLIDHRIARLDDRGFGWFAIAGGGGVASDFADVAPFAEAWIGLLNPMGIQFLPLYPMHHVGLRGRLGYDLVAGRSWYELALGVTSTFQWK